MHSEMAQVPSSSDQAEQLVRRILLAPGQRHLTAEAQSHVLALGPQAVPPLLAVLADESLQPEDSPGDGYARERAAVLLGRLHASEAIAPMLEVLETTDLLTATHQAVREALLRIGAAVLEPLFAAYATNTERDFRLSAAGVVARLGVREPRILALLLDHLECDPCLGAGCLADYGDPAALPALHAALAAQSVDTTPTLVGNQEIVELATAIQDLGGTLSPVEEAKLAHVDALRERDRAALFPAPSRRSQPKTGRNAPCPCGSGKKYKKCCAA